MSNFVEHAKRELSLLGNDDEFNNSIIKSIEAFASYGHSGGSASVAIPLLNDLLQFKNISPLTDNKNEWNEVGRNTWQSRRNPEAFSEDSGKTYYLLSERDNLKEGQSLIIHNSEKTE